MLRIIRTGRRLRFTSAAIAADMLYVVPKLPTQASRLLTIIASKQEATSKRNSAAVVVQAKIRTKYLYRALGFWSGTRCAYE